MDDLLFIFKYFYHRKFSNLIVFSMYAYVLTVFFSASASSVLTGMVIGSVTVEELVVFLSKLVSL